MGNELGILFTYHIMNKTVLDNFNSFKKHNPDALVVPISSGLTDLPGTFVTKHPLFEGKLGWRNHDIAFYQFYKENKQPCKRWLFVEWDTYCNCDIARLYQDFWDCDFVVNYTHEQGSNWWWFEETHKIPENLKQYISGISPMTCSLLSDRALKAITENSHLLESDIFCELRIATLARYCGFEIKVRRITTVFCEEQDFICLEATKAVQSLWHPMKD